MHRVAHNIPEIDAMGQPLSPPLARQIVAMAKANGWEPKVFELHYSQRYAWEYTEIRFGIEHYPIANDPSYQIKRTMAGIEMNEFRFAPRDQVWLMDERNTVIGRIFNLALPKETVNA